MEDRFFCGRVECDSEDCPFFPFVLETRVMFDSPLVVDVCRVSLHPRVAKTNAVRLFHGTAIFLKIKVIQIFKQVKLYLFCNTSFKTINWKNAPEPPK